MNVSLSEHSNSILAPVSQVSHWAPATPIVKQYEIAVSEEKEINSVLRQFSVFAQERKTVIGGGEGGGDVGRRGRSNTLK